MAGKASNPISREIESQRLVAYDLVESFCLAMTGEAIGIGITPAIFDWLLPAPCHIEQPVSKPVTFGCKRTMDPVRCMTRVALVGGDPFLSVMSSRECGTGRILHITHERFHHMAAGTGPNRLRLPEERYRGTHKRDEREDKKP